MQLRLLHPKLVVLDEVDSGLDVDAFRMVASMLSSLRSPDRTFLIVTHNFALVEELPPDRVFVMENGRIIRSGGAGIVGEIARTGF